jgi:hypothetical protein
VNNPKHEVRTVLETALQQTVEDLGARDPSGKASNRRLSDLWLRNVGEGLEKLAGQDARLYSRKHSGEFLFDLTIADATGLLGKRLWAVESEFAKRSANVERDFAKLLWADVENRLFVYSESPRLKVFELAKNMNVTAGRFYICSLPHPSRWTFGRAEAISLHRVDKGNIFPL